MQGDTQMALMTKEHKAQIAEALKTVVPADWKYSLAIKDHQAVCMTIRSAPIDLPAAAGRAGCEEMQLNPYVNPAETFKDPELAAIFGRIKDALNLGNHDHSDTMCDIFDVGHYVELLIGRYDKPFQLAA